MIDIFEESANEYAPWFIRHEFSYRSELAARKINIMSEKPALNAFKAFFP